MKFLDRLIGESEEKRKWLAIGISSVIALLLIIWAIYGVEEYGMALFILTPVFIGACPVVIYGYQKEVTPGKANSLGWIALTIVFALLMLFAMEGLICLVMAAPFAILLSSIGSYFGYLMARKKKDNRLNFILLFLVTIPAMSFWERNNDPELIAVTTSVEVDASPMEVWDQVVSFPHLEEPEELLFKAGIAYPIEARIEGKGVGAIRYCNFNTGCFVEPITVWDEGKRLAFDVLEQPAPLKELSFWDVNAPHLHDYFVSKKGEFRLLALPGGKTRLIGTTWYYHNIKPDFYWQFWSKYIVHKIHMRVLEHIKSRAEKKLQ